MGDVSLSINGRQYGIACDNGQEDRVLELGYYIDQRVREISRAGAAANESHLLVLAALVLADEIYDLREALQRQGAETRRVEASLRRMETSDEEERVLADIIQHISSRIGSLAERIERR